MLITPDLLLEAYMQGIFPMSHAADDPELFWLDPEHRGIIPLDGFHVPKRLARTYRQKVFDVRINTDFDQTIHRCAEIRDAREGTWINQRIIDLYNQLHERGYCHSVECWQNQQLVGGLYGVCIGGAFFGESMFSRARDASKIALVHLVERLKCGGFSLLDTQFVNAHLTQFGVIEIPQSDYKRRLALALKKQGDFKLLDKNQ